MVVQRRWLLFFGDGSGPAWWKPFLRPGFAHVSAAAWFGGGVDRWVYLNATCVGLQVELWRPDEFNVRLAQLIEDSSVILAFPSVAQRTMPPRSWWCVGMVKALLGIRCRALLPYQLYRHLLRIGAEVVEVPSESTQAENSDGRVAGQGRPGGDDASQSGTGTGGARPHPRDARAARV